MGLNDDREKLEQARDYLLRSSRYSQEYEAAEEHLYWVIASSSDPWLAARASSVLAEAERRKRK